MKSRQVYQSDGLRTFVVVMDKGDEAFAELTAFAADQNVKAASLTWVGAAHAVTLGYFDRDVSDYAYTDFNEQLEVLSLVGDIAMSEDQPAVHAHISLGRRDSSVIGGHLKKLIVWPTLEVVVTEVPGHLAKKRDPETGLALIDLAQRNGDPA